MNLTIIIPTYNRATTIGRTIESFIAQNFKDWDMFVVDDHSIDNTKEVVERYHQQDTRINYLLNEQAKGAQGARNTGILHAKSEWVIIFDSDDYVYPDFIEKMIPFCDNPYDVITCYARKVNVQNGETELLKWGGNGNIEKGLFSSEVYVNFDNCIFRKSRLYEIGLLSEDCPAYQELDTHIRLSRFCRYKSVPIVLMDYMWGGADTMSIQSNKNIAGYSYVMLHNCERWKKVEPESFKYRWLTMFRRVDTTTKFKMISAAPTYTFYIPYIYACAFFGWLSRRLHIDQ